MLKYGDVYIELCFLFVSFFLKFDVCDVYLDVNFL